MKNNRLFLALFSGIIIAASQLRAQDGTLDGTFGTGGIVTTSFGNGSIDEAHDVAIQPDGKIVAAGSSVDPNTEMESFSLARYITNGALDNSFGTGGKVITSVIPGFNCSAFAVELQSDGKIVVAGHANDTNLTTPQNGYFVAARYYTNGTLDSSFGVNGIASLQVPATFDPNVMVEDMLIQPDSQIVIGGGAYVNMVDGDMVFVRFDYNGNPDPAFGVSGMSIQAPPFGGATPMAMASQSDGRIVVACMIDAGTHNDPMLTTLDTNGIVDQNFGSAGFIFPTYGFSSAFFGVAVQSDSKIVGCGFGTNGAVIARFYDDGTTDGSFGTSGSVIIPIGTSQDAEFEDVMVQPDGKIVAAGMAEVQFAMARVSSSGVPDPGFGSGGIVQTTIGPGITDMAAAIDLQPDGKILLAGFSYSMSMSTPSKYALARYTNTILGTGETGILNSEVHVFPNPASEKITIELPGNCDEAYVYVYNSTGELVSMSVSTGVYAEIDVDNLPDGIYTITTSCTAGIWSQKLAVINSPD